MLTERERDALEQAWQPARAAGVLGSASLDELLENAAGFLPAAFRVVGECHAVDVGTGAGVPGLLLALMTSTWRWDLIDASARRVDMARAAAAALEGPAGVAIHHARVDDLARDPDWRGCVDLAVARRFGPPPELAECALPLLRVGGALHVSVSAEGERRWRDADLTALAARVEDGWTTPGGRYLRIVKVGESSAPLPRRPAARRRAPLF